MNCIALCAICLNWVIWGELGLIWGEFAMKLDEWDTFLCIVMNLGELGVNWV